MSTVKVVDLISRAGTILQDTGAVRWPAVELQGWLNDGYKEIVAARPDSNIQTSTYTCVAGYKQNISSLSSRAYSLVDVICNSAATSKKKAINLVTRKSLDAMRPSWYNETPTINIEKYVREGTEPKEFLVYPPATTLARLEVSYAAVPDPHALTESQLTNPATTDVIRIDDIYSNPLLDYMLYRAYSKDSEQQGNATRAVAHYQAMTASLQLKAQSDNAIASGAA